MFENLSKSERLAMIETLKTNMQNDHRIIDLCLELSVLANRYGKSIGDLAEILREKLPFLAVLHFGQAPTPKRGR
jgi:hypothetical protein